MKWSGLGRVLTGRTWASLAGAVLILVAAAAAQSRPGLNTNVPKVGKRRVVVSRRIVVSIPDRRLALFENYAVVKTYNVSVGAAVSPSPTGSFQIVNRIPKANYYHRAVVIPSSDRSPIGTRWLGLNKKSYGIHGTNEPRSIGRAASHGCIRLRNRDVEDFYERVQVGDVVEIRGERDAETVALFGGAAKVIVAQAQASSEGGGQEQRDWGSEISKSILGGLYGNAVKNCGGGGRAGVLVCGGSSD